MKKILKIIVIIFIVLFLLGLILNWLAESYYKQGLEKSNKKQLSKCVYFFKSNSMFDFAIECLSLE